MSAAHIVYVLGLERDGRGALLLLPVMGIALFATWSCKSIGFFIAGASGLLVFLVGFAVVRSVAATRIELSQTEMIIHRLGRTGASFPILFSELRTVKGILGDSRLGIGFSDGRVMVLGPFDGLDIFTAPAKIRAIVAKTRSYLSED